MLNLDCLPFDVIDYILNCECISYIDLCRFSSVSKLFSCIAKNNKLWKTKYVQMWPELAKLYNASDTDWYVEFRFRIDIKKLVSKKLSDLSDEYYHCEMISREAFLYFIDISRNHPLGSDIVIDELENIIHHGESYLNLTHKYYALRALRYMRHSQLEMRWKKFLAQPSDQMSFVEGGCLISEWSQPTVSECSTRVSVELENIVKLILKKIKELFPHHPVLKQGMLKEDRISSSLWSPRHCKDIIQCINSVMFEELSFFGSVADCSSSDEALIHEVLVKKSGISITLGIIYLAIAAKLGVCCETTNFPVHFVLKWLEHPDLDEKNMYTFIDVLDNGALKSYKDMCDLTPHYVQVSPSWPEPMTPVEVFIKWAWFLVEFGRQRDVMGENSVPVCDALELIYVLNPDDIEHKLLLARLYMHLKINTNEAISMLQEIIAVNPLPAAMIRNFSYMYQSTLQTLEAQRISFPSAKSKVVKRRAESPDVKFAVGMIMKHKKYFFRCVIYGWDNECSASQDWIERMGVNDLLHKCKQPFYYVLVEDGSNRYAAQENLEIDREKRPIFHMKIGRYFESFHGSYYTPNKQTLVEYPDDVTACKDALRQEI